MTPKYFGREYLRAQVEFVDKQSTWVHLRFEICRFSKVWRCLRDYYYVYTCHECTISSLFLTESSHRFKYECITQIQVSWMSVAKLRFHYWMITRNVISLICVTTRFLKRRCMASLECAIYIMDYCRHESLSSWIIFITIETIVIIRFFNCHQSPRPQSVTPYKVFYMLSLLDSHDER